MSNQRMDHGVAALSTTPTARADVIAGLTGAAVVLPKAMAYAVIAGLPVTVGLYTALVPMLVYAALGTSRVLSVSSTATLAILTSTEIAQLVPDGNPAQLVVTLATLAALTGLLLLAARVLRLGFLANFISTPVLTGFKAGIGLVIVLDQLPKLLGIHIEKQGFFLDIFSILKHLTSISTPTLLVGACTIAFLAVSERVRPHSPVPLVAVALGILASWWLGLDARGVATVGNIPQGLPSVTLPSLDLVWPLFSGALGIALMSFTESIAASRAFVGQSDPPIDPNRELFALGAANLAGALVGAMPAGGGTSQTAVVRAVGGHSQKASVVTALAALATMLVLAPLLGLLPQAVLAGVVIVYTVGLIQPREFAAIHRFRTMELRWAFAALVGVLVFGTLDGILVAIVISLIGLASQAVNPNVYVIGRKRGEDVLRPERVDHDDEQFEGLLIVRPEGRLFFVNSRYVADRIEALVRERCPQTVALDLSRVPDIEYSAFETLQELDRRLSQSGVTVWYADMSPTVLVRLRTAGFVERIGNDRLFPNVRSVISHVEAVNRRG